jgi:hypothetical protein
MKTTILKQVDKTPYAMFGYQGTADTPIIGCDYKNFTIDAYETAWDEITGNKVYSKAFAYQYVIDCTFDHLILQGTLATALGTDYLNRVDIGHIYLIDCGRAYDPQKSGRSGIGIGTGGWEEENFFIHNCVCDNCGQYGIFIENQTNLNYGGNTDFSKGCIISDCVVRDGMNKGIGIVGGQNVTVIGCEVYENEADGIYIDGKCKNVKIISCDTSNNNGNGITIAPKLDSENITVSNNMIVSNGLDGIKASPILSLTNLFIVQEQMKGMNIISMLITMILMLIQIKLILEVETTSLKT